MNLTLLSLAAYFAFCIALVFHAVYREQKMRRERDAILKLLESEQAKTQALETELKKVRNAKVFLRIPLAQINKAILN